jgi:hypothetical protein
MGENNPINKGTMERNRLFSNKEAQMFNKYMKTCLTSSAIREMQIKLHWDSITSQSNGCHQENKQQMCGKCGVLEVVGRNTYSLLVGM